MVAAAATVEAASAASVTVIVAEAAVTAVEGPALSLKTLHLTPSSAPHLCQPPCRRWKGFIILHCEQNGLKSLLVTIPGAWTVYSAIHRKLIQARD